MLVVLALLFAALALLAVLFPWDVLRGPVNRYVSESTGRKFEITRRLDVKLGFNTRVIADGLVFANPPWATEPNLVEAERAEFTVRLWPLLVHRRVELPWISLQRPRLGLEMLPDGRRSWSLEREGERDSSLVIGTMQVDQGSLRFIAPDQGADIRADFALEASSATGDSQLLPLSFRGGGRWRGEAFVAEGRAGNVLALREGGNEPFPAEIYATAGKTSIRATGRVESLADFEGADITLAVRGRNLAELHRITGAVLPETPAYTLEGRLRRTGERWEGSDLRAVVGRSQLAGDLAYDTSGEVPLLTGALVSKRLDFDDLAPMVGLAPKSGGSNNASGKNGGTKTGKNNAKNGGSKQAASRPQDKDAAANADRVLPDSPIDLSRLGRMNADVRVTAERVVDAKPLPVDRLQTHVRLQGGRLLLDPLDVGLAGGRLAGVIDLDGKARPAQLKLQMQAQGLRLERLMPSAETAKASTGTIQGRIELASRGNSVADLLGGASGDFAMLMGRGQISNLLLELAGLDGGEIIRFMMGQDQRVLLRCGAAAFDIRQGVMSSRALVLDTADTVIYGEGAINLANERLELTFKPYPKDPSILAFRSPLKLGGTLGKIEAGVEKAPIAARAAAVLALSAINPLLGLAATVETGPGQDADCTEVLKQAATPRQAPASQPPARGAPSSRQ